MQKFPVWLGIVIGFVVGALAGVGVMGLVRPMSPEASLEMFNPLPRTQKDTNWVAQVGDYVINQEDLTRGVELFLAQLPPAQRAQAMNNPGLKAQLLEEFINQYVVLFEAMNDPAFDTPENRYLIQASIRQAVYQLYLRERIPQDTSVFVPTAAEINAFYAQNRQQLARMNIPAAQMQQFIQQELGNRKLQEWANRYVQQLREAYPIRRNPEAMGAPLGTPLSPLPLGQ